MIVDAKDLGVPRPTSVQSFSLTWLRRASRDQLWRKLLNEDLFFLALWMKRPASIWIHEVQKTVFHDLTSATCPKINNVGLVLGLGNNFIIRPKATTLLEWSTAFRDTLRRASLKQFFRRPELSFPLPSRSRSTWLPNSNFCNVLMRQQVPELIQTPNVQLNLSRRQKQALRDLSGREDLMVCLTDKNLGMALIEKSDYVLRIHEEIRLTPQAFNSLPFSIEHLHSLQTNQIKQILSIIGEIWDDKRARRIHQFVSAPLAKTLKCCNLFGLPKLHKPGRRMRLVFPMSSHVFGPIHRFISTLINHFILSTPTAITHILEVLHGIEGRSFSGNDMLFKADIATMYSSADRDFAFDAVIKKVETDHGAKTFFRGGILSWRMLLDLAHQNLEFVFEEALFEQSTGVPIGSPCGPPIAILALHDRMPENLMSLKRIMDLIYFGIYFDDIFGVIRDGSPNLLSQNINQITEGTPFIIDSSSIETSYIKDLVNIPMTFLDVEFYAVRDLAIEGNFILRARVYTKPIGTYQYVPWRSAHPPGVKKGVIRSELSRRLRLCSTESDWVATCSDLKTKLANRGYPSRVFNEVLESFSWTDRSISRSKTIERILTRRHEARFAWHYDRLPTSIAPSIPLIIKYDPRFHKAIKEKRVILRRIIDETLSAHHDIGIKMRVVIAFKMGRKLIQVLQIKENDAVNRHRIEDPNP